MPSSMIHFLTAYEIDPQAPGDFWVGNIAPDYATERTLKDQIHFRDRTNRWQALDELYATIEKTSPFERGWFLHLFTDTCWSEEKLVEYKRWFENTRHGEDWFNAYREETGHASYYLYHHLPWIKEIWPLFQSAPLPASLAAVGQYRDNVCKKHAESSPDSFPEYFTYEILTDFAQSTANRYRERYL